MSGRKQEAAPAGSEKEQAKRVEVVLTQDHTHAGKPCKAGQTISVLPHQKAWLQELGKVAKDTKGEGN